MVNVALLIPVNVFDIKMLYMAVQGKEHHNKPVNVCAWSHSYTIYSTQVSSCTALYACINYSKLKSANISYLHIYVW